MSKTKQAKGYVKTFNVNSFLRDIDKELLILLLKRFSVVNNEFFKLLREESKSHKNIIEAYIHLSKIYSLDEFEQQAAYINDFNGDSEAYFLVNRAKELKLNTNQTPLNLACELFLKHKTQFEEIQSILQAEFSKGFSDYLSSSFESLGINATKKSKIKKAISDYSKEQGKGISTEIESYEYEDKTR